jgi:hypothetical protein
MTRQLRLKGRVLRAGALLGLSFAVAAAIAPAAADKVGVAAAVNPDAFSSLAGAPQSQLNIGKSIFFNERIKTTDSGLVQVDSVNLSFGGDLKAPGAPAGNHFVGSLTGSLPTDLNGNGSPALNGNVVGSFVKSGGQVAGTTPAGVIGNWDIGNDRYKAGGILAGSQAVPTQ